MAIGDQAIEELFVLVEAIGKERVRVLLSPHDPATRPLLPVPAGMPVWTSELYGEIEAALKAVRQAGR